MPGDWDELGIPKLARMLPNAIKCQSYIFYHFSVIKGKPTGQGGITPPRLGLICNCLYLLRYLIAHSFADKIL